MPNHNAKLELKSLRKSASNLRALRIHDSFSTHRPPRVGLISDVGYFDLIFVFFRALVSGSRAEAHYF